jgi:hypothetical protein
MLGERPIDSDPVELRERGKPWELRGQQLIAQCVRFRGRVGESGIPAVEVVGELVVEDSDADLKEQVGTLWGPAHLLFFDHAFFPN